VLQFRCRFRRSECCRLATALSKLASRRHECSNRDIKSHEEDVGSSVRGIHGDL